MVASVWGFSPTRAYRPGNPGATTISFPPSGTFNYGRDSFIAGPAIVLIARLMQGFSAGGEWGGSTAFIVEWAPEGKRGGTARSSR